MHLLSAKNLLERCSGIGIRRQYFYGQSFSKVLRSAAERTENEAGATIFGYYVRDPREYGVVEFDENGKALSIEENRKIRSQTMQYRDSISMTMM